MPKSPGARPIPADGRRCVIFRLVGAPSCFTVSSRKTRCESAKAAGPEMTNGICAHRRPYRWLMTIGDLDSAIAIFVSKARSAAEINMNSAILKALPIPLPPLPEQRRIASIPDQADNLRATRREAVRSLEGQPRLGDGICGISSSLEIKAGNSAEWRVAI